MLEEAGTTIRWRFDGFESGFFNGLAPAVVDNKLFDPAWRRHF